MASKQQFESLYQSVSRELQAMKAELSKELGYTSMQLSSLYNSVNNEANNEALMREFRYTQKQIQSLYEGVENVVEEQIAPKVANGNSEDMKAVLAELAELKSSYAKLQADYESLKTEVGVHTDKIIAAIQGPKTEAIDYERLADLVAEKLAAKEQSYEVVIDEDGINAIAKGVANELGCQCVCEPNEEMPAEAVCVCEPAEETPAEEPAPVEETPVAPVEEVKEELAAAQDPLLSFEDLDENNLVDAETGLIIRLKKSFTAKMKQSEEDVKSYYSQIKNALTSYKKINSNVSWHGDRFNFGRDTVAKMNICGKTLCLYLALDPNDPEFKSTIYHQKDVGGQKAYESTPFMVKIKSDAAAKKAVRLAAALADKLATDKEENFVETDYVTEFAYETTKKLYEEGFIKATKEKKVDLNF